MDNLGTMECLYSIAYLAKILNALGFRLDWIRLNEFSECPLIIIWVDNVLVASVFIYIKGLYYVGIIKLVDLIEDAVLP